MVADEAGLDVGAIDAWSLKLAAGEDPAASGFREVNASAVPVFIPDAPEDGRDEGLALIEIEAAPIKQLASRSGRQRRSAQQAGAADSRRFEPEHAR